MFEYLMPILVMPNYEGALLDHTCKAAVQRQIEYGKSLGVPWGISESGYNRTDVHLNYQYRAFGVPGLGLKRGLAEDLVIAPYATAMALMVAPRAACENLQRLAIEEREGAFGFYEAIDYTPSRLPPGETSAVIRSYMAHHQGMSLLALANVLHDYPMQRRFLACPMLKAADLLLQERVPKTVASVFTQDLAPESSRTLSTESESRMRVFTNPTPTAPDVHLLSNGHYHVVITSAGGGYSRWEDLALTRWREDATRDNWGTFVYLRDVATGEFWSTAYQPTLCGSKGYEAIFSQARAEFRQCHAELEVHTEISVSPEDDVELRRITITNRSSRAREIELTSYAEVVLAPPAADAAHPAFSDLFVQTEFDRKCSAVLCTRRGRTEEEKPPWLLHLMVGQGGEVGAVSCETDRARFVGRGGTLVKPAAMKSISALSDTTGSVLDPIVSLRRTVSLAPHETATISLVSGATPTREAAMAQVEKYQSLRMAERAFDLAWTHSQVTLRQLNASEADAQLYDRMAGALIYADPARRADPSVLRSNRRGQSGLWSYGVSGDSPVVLLRIRDATRIEIVRQLIQAHAYWRMKGLTVELVILNEDVSVYRQPLYEQITSLIAAGTEAQLLDKPGGIFVCRLEQIPHEDRILLQSVARIAVDDERGTLAEQMDLRRVLEPLMPALTPARSVVRDAPKALGARETIFQNGLGGFTRDGHEYVITLHPGQTTPAPWVNVLANPTFGTVVSESGSAYTWVENSHEFRLTPWSNDPVQDTTGEAFYIRDELTGQVWSPSPLPTRGTTPYVIRHGFGYTVFEHCENGIASELWIYVAMDAPVKFNVLKLRNVSGRPRRISVTGYWEWVLGDLRQNSLLHVQTEVDLKSGALLARNYYNTEFPDRIAFVDTGDLSRTVTGDRKEFLGRNGTLAEPAALKRTRLSGKVGAGLDPCGAVQVVFDLAAEQERETRFRLGVGRNLEDVQNLVRRFRGVDASRVALEGVWSYWNRTLGAVNVDTPDPAVNVMANGWLLYQVLSCRFWGRTGFYQSGGAYGFRDQLQDVMALVHAEPALTREHLLRAASRQFREGDVQHWWHPPTGRGVRTHISDDYLWLPYVACRYVSCLGDTGVLDENISFLEARPVKPEEESYYDLPNRSEESATLYQHCVRAIEHGLKFGEHGLPLMGCGDWNDGMNLVGKDGRGESVWLAFFLFDVLTEFSKLAQSRKDGAFAERCLAEARKLRANIEAHTWDGAWYLRAYFDNGEPLGSQTNPECQIDSLPQSWSVISGAGDPARSRQAMQSVDRRLVRREAGLIQLFDPPFDKSALNPGYIKGYIPGVRENGGQYTHGAIWTAMAFALLGESERAWELFSLLNPVHHSGTPEQIATYKVEPYVVAADVYGVAPHTGRGGWTWYTGSAGWMYRLLVETLLGVHLEGDQLRLNPRLPKTWPSCKIHYRFRQTVYHITVVRLANDATEADSLFLDGQELAGEAIPLRDDRQEHTVEMKIR
jgi:cyclic beta-1,2-glucan synthetase